MRTTANVTGLLLSLACAAAAAAQTAAPTTTPPPPPESTCAPTKPDAKRYRDVKAEPRLGETISGYPKWKREMIMASGGDSRKRYSVRHGGVAYTVGTHRESDVIKWVGVTDPAFRTPEGLAVGDSLEKVRAVAETEVQTEPGWAFHARLPSGWHAAFVQGKSMTEGELSPSARVCFFFKREH